MNNMYSRASNARMWIAPAIAISLIIVASGFLTISDAGRNLVGLATGSTLTCESLPLGNTITGTVADAPGYDCYEFEVDDQTIKDSNAVLISLNSKSGSSLDADLYAPNSEVALGNTGYAWVTASGTETNSGALPLDKGTGKYSVKVWSYSDEIGDYEVSISTPTSNTSTASSSQSSDSSVTCSNISLDTLVSGNIEGSNKFDCDTFTASQSNNVIINMTSKNGVALDADLYAPDSQITESNTGFKYVTAASATPDVTLNKSLDKGDGAYKIKLWSYGNKAEGEYDLIVSIGDETVSASSNASETCKVLTVEDSISGTISNSDKYDCYKYSAKSGDVITLDITSLSGTQLDADIFQPGSSAYADQAGYYWISTQASSKTSKTITLDKGDGDYIIKAWSYGNKAEGKYELNISPESVAKTSSESSTTATVNNGTVSTSTAVVIK